MPRREIINLFQKCILTFKPQWIAIKAISKYQRRSQSLGLIVSSIVQLAEENDIQIKAVSIDQIKSELCTDAKPTEKKAFENLAVLYPELRQYLNRPNKWQADYYHNLLSAGAIGVVLLRSLANSK